MGRYKKIHHHTGDINIAGLMMDKHYDYFIRNYDAETSAFSKAWYKSCTEIGCGKRLMT